jgi:hypothetical protein
LYVEKGVLKVEHTLRHLLFMTIESSQSVLSIVHENKKSKSLLSVAYARANKRNTGVIVN